MPSRSLAIVLGLLVGALPFAALAQARPFASLAEAAAYRGPDREARLAAGAKQEGQLMIYTSAQVKDLGKLANAFEKKYGVKVSIWRAASEQVLQRTVTEAQAHRYTVDVVETNGPELEALHREELLQAVRSPYQADLIPQALPAHHEWAGTRLNVFVQAYNTNAVRKDELPKRWEDLLQPRWKGRLAIEAGDYDWLSGLFGKLGEANGAKLFKEIVAKNGISVRKGHTLLTQLVVSGEVPLALTVYNYKAEQFRKKGAPIDWFSIGEAIARPNGVAVTRHAPHPQAALLYYDFEIGVAGQKILESRHFVPTNTKVSSALARVPMRFIDVRNMLDHEEKWRKLYEDIFIDKR